MPATFQASNLDQVRLNPYEQFKQLAPSAVIERGIFVFEGHFDLPLASALSRIQKAQNYLAAQQTQEALAEAQAAVTLAPNAVESQMMLGDAFRAAGQVEQARSAYEKAHVLAQTIAPDFQIRSLPSIQEKLNSLP